MRPSERADSTTGTRHETPCSYQHVGVNNSAALVVTVVGTRFGNGDGNVGSPFSLVKRRVLLG